MQLQYNKIDNPNKKVWTKLDGTIIGQLGSNPTFPGSDYVEVPWVQAETTQIDRGSNPKYYQILIQEGYSSKDASSLSGYIPPS